MKITTTPSPVAGRILQCATAIFCFTAVMEAPAAEPIGQVAVQLKGEELAHKKKIKVDSGKKRIEPSKLYSYEIVGKVRGKRGTPARSVVPGGMKIAKLLDTYAPGSSKFLEGSFSNPSGQLPATVLNRKFSGKRSVPGLGKVKVSLKLVGSIDADGKCQLVVKNVKFKASKQKDLGTIEYMKGAKLLISAAPVVTFLRNTTTVEEDAGSVSVAVRRTTNRHGVVAVDYTTVADSADSSDFTPTSGTITFDEGEISKTITVPIIDNNLVDGVRRFTIEISNPSEGAFLDSTSTKIVILDDE